MTFEVGAASSPARAGVGAWADSRAWGARAAAAALGFSPVVLLGFADGGYWPSSWAWALLAFSWAIALALIARDDVRLGPPLVVMACAAGLLAAWTFASSLWTISVSRTAFESERTLMYLAAIGALAIVVRRHAVTSLLTAMWAGVTLVSFYALASRLFPDRLGVFDPKAGYRLSEPVGYWNGLGILAAMGALLALGVGGRARSLAVRGLGAASLVVLVPTMYFTFSRGAWVAFGLGVLAALIVDPRRVQLATTVLTAAPGVLVVLFAAYRSDDLTTRTAPIDAAAQQGHRLAAIIVVAAALNAALAVLLAIAARRVEFSPRVRRAYAGTLAVAVAALVVAPFALYGNPIDVAQRAYTSFTAPVRSESADLNDRLFRFNGSGRVAEWRVARDVWRENRWLGSGAGTYEVYWHRLREDPWKVRDAHSLQLETLAELGVVGLALLLTVVAVPFFAVRRSRAAPLVPVAFGAYVAYLVHAGVDWDWELPVLTFAGLASGIAVVVAAKPRAARPLSVRTRRVGAALAGGLALAAVPLVAGNGALDASRIAAQQGEWAAAADEARRATRWLPWAQPPWRRLGEAEVALGRREEARRAFATATDKDETDWEAWYRLAIVSDGDARARAARRALELNPKGLELDVLRDGGGEEGR